MPSRVGISTRIAATKSVSLIVPVTGHPHPNGRRDGWRSRTRSRCPPIPAAMTNTGAINAGTASRCEQRAIIQLRCGWRLTVRVVTRTPTHWPCIRRRVTCNSTRGQHRDKRRWTPRYPLATAGQITNRHGRGWCDLRQVRDGRTAHDTVNGGGAAGTTRGATLTLWGNEITYLGLQVLPSKHG